MQPVGSVGVKSRLTVAVSPAAMTIDVACPVLSFQLLALVPAIAMLLTVSAPVPLLVKVNAFAGVAPRPRTAEKTSRGVEGLARTASSGA